MRPASRYIYKSVSREDQLMGNFYSGWDNTIPWAGNLHGTKGPDKERKWRMDSLLFSASQPIRVKVSLS